MGTYDTVLVPCPKCGEHQGFQTKSGPCLLDEYALKDCPEDVLRDVNRHAPATCAKCKTKYLVGANRDPIAVPREDGMHTTKDYINKDAPELWIIHNGDFSGDAYVHWRSMTEEKVIYMWRVPGKKLLTGAFSRTEYYEKADEFSIDKIGERVDVVPQHVVGRAVMLAVRTVMTNKMISLVEQL